jgi:hypothetical protein
MSIYGNGKNMPRADNSACRIFHFSDISANYIKISLQSSSINVDYCGKEVKVSDLTRRSTVTQVLRKLVKQLGLRNETSWEIVEVS